MKSDEGDAPPNDSSAALTNLHHETPDTSHGVVELLRQKQDTNEEILGLLKRLDKNDAYIVKLLERRFDLGIDLSDVIVLSKELWDHSKSAWEYAKHIQEDVRERERQLNADMTLGIEFLYQLAPCAITTRDYGRHTRLYSANISNLQHARKLAETWIAGAHFSIPWQYDLLVESNTIRPHTITPENLETVYSRLFNVWPREWDVLNAGNSVFDRRNQMRVTHVYPNMFEDPVENKNPYRSPVTSLKTKNEGKPICGIHCQITIDNLSNIMDFDTVATTLCFVRGSMITCYNDPEFLDGHLGDWRERSIEERTGTRLFTSSQHPLGTRFDSPRRLRYGVFMHYMQSFMVCKSTDAQDPTKQPHSGIKCKREQMTLKSPFDGRSLKLTERRYSTALSLFPMERPLGHYTLVSIIDAKENENELELFKNSPVDGMFIPRTSNAWSHYGLLPAGLFTGVSAFQLQICSFIDTWEKDWRNTMNELDILISVKLRDLGHDEFRKRLMFDTNELERSELYFTVLQILRIFSESIRAAPDYLTTLSTHVRSPVLNDCWFEKDSPRTPDVHRVLNYNWQIVLSKQESAAKRLLERIERKTDEVKSLRDGLFNAQSVQEAIKGRHLNKYLFVFTVVSVIFLPPSFVATFYGTQLFEEATQGQTKKVFWSVLAAVSGFTYIIAGIGISGVNWSSHKWGRFWERRKQKITPDPLVSTLENNQKTEWQMNSQPHSFRIPTMRTSRSTVLEVQNSADESMAR
ncbi:hypothetical protein PT974_00445 [Cladobotryum mycophilum]|uniref:Uncharacterized protein n=1 Tax=Cladobotryum mycophilum TaxID=491253 RepID=A0ABR0T127_9HYPO